MSGNGVCCPDENEAEDRSYGGYDETTVEVHVHDAPTLQNPAKVKIDDVYPIQEPLVDTWVGDISNGSELGGQRRRRTGLVCVSQRWSLAHSYVSFHLL